MVIKKDANNGLQALADVGLPNGKTDLVELEQFTFDKFYKIYQTICPRSSIVNKTGNRDINIFVVHELLLHRFHISPSLIRIPYPVNECNDTATNTKRITKEKMPTNAILVQERHRRAVSLDHRRSKGHDRLRQVLNTIERSHHFDI